MNSPQFVLPQMSLYPDAVLSAAASLDQAADVMAAGSLPSGMSH
jgi:hypothetical protein